jgi:acetyl esterase/lipase
MMKVERDIAYAPDWGERGKLDLYLPGEPAERPLVMVIHGGGLREFSKERMAGISAFIAEKGWVAVNINYRLLSDAPYPAALQDVLAAYRWLWEADQADLRRQETTRIALLGASAGAFLAMMAGLILGRQQVRAMVSISGPVLPGRYASEAAKGGLDPRLFSAPTELVGPHAPPLLAIHSRNDQLVKPQESIAIIERMQAAGCCADLYLYDGPGKLHGIWRDDRLPPRLFGHIEDVIGSFLSRTL